MHRTTPVVNDLQPPRLPVIICSAITILILIVALASELHTYRQTPLPLILLCIVIAIAQGLIPRLPHFAPWITIVTSCIVIECTTYNPLPILAALMTSITILTFSTPIQGCIGSLIVATTFCSEILTSRESWMASALNAICCAIFPMIAGLLLRLLHHRATALQIMRKHRYMDDVILQLHDHIAGNIADALVMLDSHDNDHDATSQSVRERLEEALTYTHEIVNNIESKTQSDTIAAPDDSLRELQTLVTQRTNRLQGLGCEGEFLFPSSLPSMDTNQWKLLTGLIGEICNNIAKHAQYEYGYIITLERTGDDLILQVSDVPRNAASETFMPNDGTSTMDSANETAYGMNSGLQRYQRLLEQNGGTLSVAHRDNLWTMEARISAKERDHKTRFPNR